LVISERQVPLPLKNEVVLGRADLASGWKPDVDLTAYGGTPQAGVSRMNTKITWQGAWMLEDMNSTNGTFFRGQRLAPGQRTPIQNGEMFLVAGLEVTFFEH
jgi:pSer/pThr/pTyr-binding forkhead associated (FHA) protein